MELSRPLVEAKYASRLWKNIIAPIYVTILLYRIRNVIMKKFTCPHEEWHFILMLYVHINVLTSLFVGEVQYIYHCPLWPHRELISRTCFLNTLFEVQGSKGRMNIPFCHCQSTHAQNTLVMGIVQSKKINKNKTLYNSRHYCSTTLVTLFLLGSCNIMQLTAVFFHFP